MPANEVSANMNPTSPFPLYYGSGNLSHLIYDCLSHSSVGLMDSLLYFEYYKFIPAYMPNTQESFGHIVGT